MDKDFIKGLFVDFLFGLVFAVCIAVLIVVFDPNAVKAAETVSGDFVSGNVVSSNYVSGDSVSGNVVSGNFITFDQGDQIINYLRMIIFFWFSAFLLTGSVTV